MGKKWLAFDMEKRKMIGVLLSVLATIVELLKDGSMWKAVTLSGARAAADRDSIATAHHMMTRINPRG
jgi:hypothetical protein